jgi:serine/threonine protein kinase/tetratricopeptide (TPR) repeat protein
MRPCSKPDELQQFLDGRLGAIDGDQVAAHLDECEVCRNVLEQITSRPAGQVGQARSEPASEEWVDAVLERVKARGPRPPVVNAEDRQNRDHDLAWSLIDGASHQPKWPEARSRSSAGAGPELPGFRIIREIGRGGMGVVYEAEEQNLSRRVAVKVLPARSLEDPRHIQRFEREARAAGRLHHTNIVPVFGVGQSQGTHYYVMQYIDGLGLDVVIDELRRLRQVGWNPHRSPAPELSDDPTRHSNEPRRDDTAAGRTTVADVARSLTAGTRAANARQPQNQVPGEPGPSGFETRPASITGSDSVTPSPSSLIFPDSPDGSTQSGLGRTYFDRVARIGVQAADALEYAFHQGVLHRDIKPSNLLLDVHGNTWVADFGLATTTDADDLTQSGQVLGTFRYMAPERFRGECDVRADVYSLGLTLYELVTLKAAFDETDRFELIERIQHEDPVRLRKVNRKIPTDLATVIHKAIAHEPARRYPTPRALADDLRRFLRGEPVRARRIGPLGRASKWARRHPWQTISASLLLMTLISLAGFFYWHNVQLRAQVARTQAKDAQSRRNYQEARATVQAMLGRLYDQRVEGIPRLLDLRREFRDDALGFYDRILSGAESNDPAVRADTALALNEASSLQVQVQHYAEAEKLLDRSRTLADGLLAEKPDEMEYIKIKADCLIKLGPCLLGLEKVDQALSAGAQAIAVAQRILAEDRADVVRLELLAVCYQQYGNALLAQQRRADARTYFRKAIDVRSRIDPAQLPGVTTRLAHALINEGLSFWQEQQFSQAEAIFRRAEDVLRSVPPELQARSDNIGISLAQLLINWGGMLHTSGRYAEAVSRADEGLIHIDAYLRNEPNDAAARDMCLKLHGNRGYALMGLENHRDSAAEWARVIELAPQPVPPIYRIRLAIELLKSGENARALTEAELVKPDPSIGGEDRYNVGCVFARSAASIHGDSHLASEQRAGLEKAYIKSALLWLKSAAEVGLFNNPVMCDEAKNDPDLAILAPLGEFRQIVDGSLVKF